MTRRRHGLVANLKQRIIMDRFLGSRIVATPEAIDALAGSLDSASIRMRFAPDEIYITPPLADDSAVREVDEHAIVIAEGAFSGVWIDEAAALDMLERLADWEMPKARPAFVQGAVAGVATKLYFANGKVLFAVASPYAAELEERLS